MKKIYTLLTLLFLYGISFGKHIDENTAKNIGQSFLQNQTHSPALKSNSNFQLIYKVGSHQANAASTAAVSTFFYVFNAAQNGYVIVAGDDNVTPILGYSDQGSFDPEHIPQNVAKWMEGYKSEIRYIIENKINATPEISYDWDQLKAGKGLGGFAKKSTTSVGPLMQTKWNQLPYYNALCPGGSVTGCVATAMAQIMKYWNYPATGSGFHSYNHNSYGTLSANFGSTTYDWGSMTNTLSSSNTAIATLMYQVGVSVDMDYSPESSGAYVITAQSPVTNCAEYALKTYFGYNNTLKGVQRSSYTQADWLSLIKTELDASRPVLYAGFGSGGGHCFVADGYDASNYIHFNWGWGGAYDGFFMITALNPGGVGTGGGTGGFNSGHQAVIGIQPPSAAPQNYSLALYDYLKPSANSILYGQDFSVSTNVVNNGTGSFNGDYAVAVFDNAYNFVDFVETKTGYTLGSGFVYSNNLVFSTSGLLSMLPGTYYVGLFCKPTGGNWIQVADAGSYTNLTQINVTNSNDIELYGALALTSGTTLTKGSSVSATANIVNAGALPFVGKYAVDLYNLDGSWAQAIGEYSETAGLEAGYTYSSNLSFGPASITVAPGTYLLAMEHNPNDAGWQLTGSSYFQNPIKVTVVAAAIQPDIYENNNEVASAYSLSVSFSGNTAKKNTVGSTCHVTSDNDFYKIVLPSGYNYSIAPRLHDSYNSDNGTTYTVDVLFSWSTDGVTWSEAFDDVMPGAITVNGGGTVYFHVAPYFAGETGTYLLDMALTRITNVGLADVVENQFKIYPNPAKDFITIDPGSFAGKLKLVKLINTQGKNLLTDDVINSPGLITLPLNGFADGIYTLQLYTGQGIETKKIIIAK